MIPRAIKRMAERAQATVEEDAGARDMRTLQVCAPAGQRWSDGATSNLVVQWARGATPHALEFNAEAVRDLQSRLECGLERIPEADLYLYAED